jgi:hypothetical protein
MVYPVDAMEDADVPDRQGEAEIQSEEKEEG